MIAHIKGIIEDIYDDRVVVDVNGVGFNIFVSTNTISALPGIGENIKLYTHTVVREDAFLLFGFLNKDELYLFKKIITVSGIGPKGGLAFFNILNAEELRFAILSGNAKLLSSAPGIGKKTAEKLILELKDKLDWNGEMIKKEISGNISGNSLANGLKQEAIDALVALGYGNKEANNAVMKVDIDTDDVELILKEALKFLI